MMSYGYNPAWSVGAIKSPNYQTSTFVFNSAEEGRSLFEVLNWATEQMPRLSIGVEHPQDLINDIDQAPEAV